MDLSTWLIIIGLFLNTAASIVLLWRTLSISKNIEGDFIPSMEKKTGEYIRVDELKKFQIGIWGFILFILGFILQITGILVGTYS